MSPVAAENTGMGMCPTGIDASKLKSWELRTQTSWLASLAT